VTDAARLTDGDVVLRDYHRGYVVDLPRWRVERSYPLPAVEQGETVAASTGGRRVYLGSEGDSSPVFVMQVPGTERQVNAGRAPAGAEGDVPAEPASRQAQDQGEDGEDDEGARPRARPPGYIVAVAAAMVLGLLARRYRRQRRRRPPR
jgi:hypothetical protein